jgi:hypothetical protein
LGKILSCYRQRLLLSLIAEHGGFIDEYSEIKVSSPEQTRGRSRVKLNRKESNSTLITVKGSETGVPFSYKAGDARNVIACGELWHLAYLLGTEDIGAKGGVTRYFSRVSSDFQVMCFPQAHTQCTHSITGIETSMSAMEEGGQSEGQGEEEGEGEKEVQNEMDVTKGMVRGSESREDEEYAAEEKAKAENMSAPDRDAKGGDKESISEVEVSSSSVNRKAVRYKTRRGQSLLKSESPQLLQSTDNVGNIMDEAEDSDEGGHSSTLKCVFRSRYLAFSAEDYSQHVTAGGVGVRERHVGLSVGAIDRCDARSRSASAGVEGNALIGKRNRSEGTSKAKQGIKEEHSVSVPDDAPLSLEEYMDAAFRLGREYIREGSMIQVAVGGSCLPPSTSFSSSSSSSLGPLSSLIASSSPLPQSLPLPPNRPHGTRVPLVLCTVLKVISLSAADSRAQMLKYNSPPTDLGPIAYAGPSRGLVEEVPISPGTTSEASGASDHIAMDITGPTDNNHVREVTVGVPTGSGDAVKSKRDREKEVEDARGEKVVWVAVSDGKIKRTFPLSACRQLDISEDIALNALQAHFLNTREALSSLREELENSRRRYLAAPAEEGGRSTQDRGDLGGEIGPWTQRELELFVAARKK